MPLPVINSGNVQMSYVLSDVVLNGATPPPLTLRVAKVANEAACTATGDVGAELYNGPWTALASLRPSLCRPVRCRCCACGPR